MTINRLLLSSFISQGTGKFITGSPLCELSFWQYVNLESLCPLFRLQKANLQCVNLGSLCPLFGLQKANLDVLEVIFSILQIFFREIHLQNVKTLGRGSKECQ